MKSSAIACLVAGIALGVFLANVYTGLQYWRHQELSASGLTLSQARERALAIAQGLEDYLWGQPQLVEPRVRSAGGGAGSRAEEGAIANRTLLIDFKLKEGSSQGDVKTAAEKVLRSYRGWNLRGIEWKVEGINEKGQVVVNLAFAYYPDLFPFVLANGEKTKFIKLGGTQ
jgi:hypothetical protein